MTTNLRQTIQRCVVRYLDGDMEQFERLTQKAVEEYERENHLYVSIRERVTI